MPRPASATCLARFELAALGLAIVLEHLDPALALAGILAFAIVLGALTGALAGTTVDAETASFKLYGRHTADQDPRNEQSRRGHGNVGARLAIELHIPLLCMSSRHSWREAAKRAIALI